MKTYAFSIQKGGVGKTSTSGNVAFKLAEKHKTIIIDGDPQGNLTSWFLKESPQHELADVLQGAVQAQSAIVQLRENLYILPTFAIDGDLKRYGETQLFQEPFKFDDLRATLEGLGFEYCIFDLSPGMSQLERAIILCCDEVITPLTPEFFSTDGLEIFTAEIQKINKNYRRNVQHTKIVANNYNKSFSQHEHRMSWFKKLKYDLFIIPQDRCIADSQAMGRTVFEHNAKSKACSHFVQLAEAL